jgi:hypothetical protein
MHSSTSSFERSIPEQPWTRIGVTAALLVLVAVFAWEIRVRAWGYRPALDDTADLWAERRATVRPDSLVLLGDSRALFDLDLDELDKGLGRRPVQLALVGSCPFPILEDLAKDESFHGTVICSLLPIIFFAPYGSPPVENSLVALRRFRTQTLTQRTGHLLSIPLEEHLAFLEQDDLTLLALLKQLPIPNRPTALVPPSLPPHFSTLDRERRTRMISAAEHPGELQTRVQKGWLPLFTPPPPPSFIPREAFLAGMEAAMKTRFSSTVAAVAKIQARGGRVVFVRFPFGGALKPLEEQMTPRAKIWDPLTKAAQAPGIYFEDYPELASFTCPEWSHLSDADSVEFTKRLVPHLRKALETLAAQKTEKTGNPTSGTQE